MLVAMDNVEPCVMCGEPVENYEPVFCCSGEDCVCEGLPIEPPICSPRCYDKLITQAFISLDNEFDL